MANEETPEAIRELQRHLNQLATSPSTPLEASLFDVSRSITDSIPRRLRKQLVNTVASLIPSVQQDPTLLIELAQKLVANDASFTFDDVLAIEPPVDFIRGLQAPLPAINSLTLSLLRKVTSRSRGINYVADDRELSTELVRLWLVSPSAGVADQCTEFLSSLLSLPKYWQRYSCVRIKPSSYDVLLNPERARIFGTERPGISMWNRLTTDRGLYGLIFSLCGPSTTNGGDDPSWDRSLAQGRLAELVQQCFPAPYVWQSHFRDIEERYGVREGGLAYFVALHMVRDRDDEVMNHIIEQYHAAVYSYESNLTNFRDQLSEALTNGDSLQEGLNQELVEEVEGKIVEAERLRKVCERRKQSLVVLTNGAH